MKKTDMAMGWVHPWVGFSCQNF